VTYSIVARDPETGELGVAVQSHWFSVGSIVTWARPGVGAVATQANAEAAYGPDALALLADGVPAPEALERLVAADPGGPSRQVAVVDAAGRVGAHTGRGCIAYAGHTTGPGVSCQANIMVSERVWPAMLEAFSAASDSSLTLRLLDALDAAEREGGDLRGRQSAAILVVPAEGEPWRTNVSLRVEDHSDPLPELRRLVVLQDAYRLAGQADELLDAGRHDEAARLYVQASERAPGNHELLFWAGFGTVASGDLEGGLVKVRAAIAMQPGLRELLLRLPDELAPVASAVLAALGPAA
jgi:uncharacterized Ntn-hydrolase superfamily protein